MKAYENFVNGRFTGSTSQNLIEVYNPASETQIATVPESSEGDVYAAVEAAEKAQVAWARLPAVQRGGYLHKIADSYGENRRHWHVSFPRSKASRLDWRGSR